MCLLFEQHLYIFEELLIIFCIDHSINENVCFCLPAPPHPTLTKKKYKKKKKKNIYCLTKSLALTHQIPIYI